MNAKVQKKIALFGLIIRCFLSLSVGSIYPKVGSLRSEIRNTGRAAITFASTNLLSD